MSSNLLVEASARSDTIPGSVSVGRSLSAGPVHLDFLDGLRGLAAVYVVFGHIFGTIGFDPNGPMWWVRFFPSAHFSVTIFILLSGFCLAIPVARGKPFVTRDYFLRRFIRIVPSYWITVGICLVLIGTVLSEKTGTLWDSSIVVSPGSILSHFFLVHNLVGHQANIDYPLWSVGVEWQIYFFLPLLLVLWSHLRALPTTLVVVALAWIGAHLVRHTQFVHASLHYYGVFAAGALMAKLAFDRAWAKKLKPRALNIWMAGVTILLATAAASVCLSGYDQWRYERWFDFPAMVGGCLLLLGLALDRGGPIEYLLRARVLVWIGGFSYTLYLLHAPLLQLLYQATRPLVHGFSLQLGALALAGIPIIILVSFLLSLAVERPFVRKLKRMKISCPRVEHE